MDYKKFTTLNEDIISIRKAVFVEEQGFQNEFDKFDKNCTHIVLYDKGKRLPSADISKKTECIILDVLQ